MDTALCPHLWCCLQLHLIFNRYKTCTLSCEMLPLSACLFYLKEGTEIRGRTSHLTLNLSSHSCLEILAMCPAKCIQWTGLCIQSYNKGVKIYRCWFSPLCLNHLFWQKNMNHLENVNFAKPFFLVYLRLLKHLRCYSSLGETINISTFPSISYVIC